MRIRACRKKKTFMDLRMDKKINLPKISYGNGKSNFHTKKLHTHTQLLTKEKKFLSFLNYKTYNINEIVNKFNCNIFKNRKISN